MIVRERESFSGSKSGMDAVSAMNTIYGKAFV